VNAGTTVQVVRSCRETIRRKESVMTAETRKKDKVPPPVFSRDPEKELEEKLREHPEDKNAKVDVGSDESMDASDPPSTVKPDSDQPVPSSGFPEKVR
jgi:hypothetical protein